ALRKALGEKIKGSTVIIVAQRISTILHADQILVLDDGRIVGKGTHEELLRSCEVYQEIANSQLSEEELGFMDAGKGGAAHE
ncbi:MAG: ABC transporter ATP-binding protein, partial [Actinobacteria bacterium]|nr:ABC transporter ATP-binding protein [Actinomycetota bacterium]